MIIEVFGVPGSGKTTLVSKLIAHGDYRAVPAYPPRLYAAVFCACHPLFSAMWIYALVREYTHKTERSFFRFKIAVFLNTASRMGYARIRFRPSDRVVLDEGLIQRILSLYETAEDASLFKNWFRFLPHANFIIETAYTGSTRAPKIGTERKKWGGQYGVLWRTAIEANYNTLTKVIEELKLPHCTFTWDDGGDSFEETLSCIQNG